MHRVVALVGAFVLVFGTYSFLDPQYARTAYDSARDTVATVLSAGQYVRTAAVVGGDSVAVALAEFTRDPVRSVASAGRGVRDVYASAVLLGAQMYPRERTGMTASAVVADTQAATSAPVPVDPVSVSVGAVGTETVQVAAAAAAAPAETATSPLPAVTQPIAVAVQFTGTQVAYGDLVAYDTLRHIYTLTQGADDANTYGVVVRDPALLFKPAGASDISVTRSGAALMNVTLENGPIAIGDRLTSSTIPGKARKAKESERAVATAKESFADGGVTLVAPNGSRFASGTISVNVSTAGNSSESGSQQRPCTSFMCSFDPQIIRALVRYLLSGTIAALTLTLAFKSFMSDANYGVISIGRNPLAKSTIRSLVLFNAVLALAIASAGLFAAMIVLFAG